MADLIVPQSPIEGGAAPTIRVEASGAGNVVAQFGAQVANTALKVRDKQDSLTMAETRINMQRDLGQIRQAFDQMTDPREIDREFEPRVNEARAAMLQDLPERLRPRATLAFNELANRHMLALGARSTALLQDRERANLDHLHNTSVETGATADEGTRETLALENAMAIAEAAKNGTITQQQAEARLQNFTTSAAETAAITQMTNDPAAFLEAVNNGDFVGLSAQRRATLVARAQATVASQASQAAKAADELAKTQLGLVLEAANQGRVAANESDILNTPEFRDSPYFGETLAAVNLRDERPDLARMTPDELRAEIAKEQAKTVANGYDNNRLEAMRSILKSSEKGWHDDAITQAENVGLAPPAAPEDLSAADDQTLVNFFAARANFGQQLTERGYTDAPVYFTGAEREQLSAMADIEADPVKRVHLAAMLSAGFGGQATRALAALGADPVFTHMAGQLASGGNPQTAELAFKGQQAIAHGTVDLPSTAQARSLLYDEYANVIDGMGNSAAVKDQLLQVATAIWAGGANAQVAKGTAFETQFDKALQAALGAGVNARGQATGGIQEPAFYDSMFYTSQHPKTLMPVGMTGEEFVTAWRKSATLFDAEGTDPLAVWKQASAQGATPTFAGRPITAEEIPNLTFHAVSDGLYQVYYTNNGTWFIEAGDTGQPFILNMRKFVEGMR